MKTCDTKTVRLGGLRIRYTNGPRREIVFYEDGSSTSRTFDAFGRLIRQVDRPSIYEVRRQRREAQGMGSHCTAPPPTDTPPEHGPPCQEQPETD